MITTKFQEQQAAQLDRAWQKLCSTSKDEALPSGNPFLTAILANPAPIHCPHCWHVIARNPSHPLIVEAQRPDSKIYIVCLNCHARQFTDETPPTRPQAPAVRAVAPIRDSID